MRAALLLLAALVPVAGVAAASLAVTKAVTVVSDPLGAVRPRILPGTLVDYGLTVTNPAANALVPVRRVQIVDDIPTTVILRVADLAGAGRGPVEFLDGDLLQLGLTGSNLAYSFAGLASIIDGLEFSDGTSWAYVPVADADGFDARVRAVRVSLSGTQATASRFRLRYRAKVR